jgi:uncharacterized protein (DUF1501 family)
MLSRRQFVLAATGAAVLPPRMAFAHARSDARFVFVIQRGAADGLNIVVPYGDPAYAGLRGGLAIDVAGATRLDGTFALHPALAQSASLYAAGEVLFVQAIASPYRDRSHFDGQNVLETGGAAPYQSKQGWMNRLAALMTREQGAAKGADAAIAFAPTVPMALRGPFNVASYAPSRLPAAPDDLLTRVSAMYAQDAQFKPLWRAALDARGLASDVNARQDPAGIGKMAASFLARADGPRIAMIETAGWDTHTAQNGRLAAQLKSLDQMVAALRENMGTAWAQTTVLVATEFGRTAAANGTGGTDHGTASAAMLFGGRVKGGRVLADWPGLQRSALLDGRDLKPTASLDSLIAGAAGETFGLDPASVYRSLFPLLPAQPSTGWAGLLRA